MRKACSRDASFAERKEHEAEKQKQKVDSRRGCLHHWRIWKQFATNSNEKLNKDPMIGNLDCMDVCIRVTFLSKGI